MPVVSRPLTARRFPWLACAVVALVAWAVGIDRRAVAVDLARDRDRHGAAYAGSAACVRCHAEHSASWHRTFHRTMTQKKATDASVVGDFANASYRYGGVTAHMSRDPAGRFVMGFARDDGTPEVKAVVVRTVGSRRYQQYLADVGGGIVAPASGTTERPG